MAHKEQRDFIEKIKELHSEKFNNRTVLDIGSRDINGNNKIYFTNSEYTGVDHVKGKNVDIVGMAHNIEGSNLYDTIISTECLEHDKFYKETLQAAVRLLKSNGLLLFTCATTGRPIHGIGYNTEYKNLTESDIREAINVDDVFVEYEFEINTKHKDLYFYGIKR